MRKHFPTVYAILRWLNDKGDAWIAPLLFFTILIPFFAIHALADSPQAGFKGSTSGAATTEAFVTIGNSAGLSSERALTGTANDIVVTDNGANSTVVISTGSNVAKINQGNSWSTAQIPSALGSIDLGSTTKAWRSLYLSPNGGSNYAVLTPTTLTGNRTVNLPDADSTTVQANTGAANNFLTAISAQGVVSRAQPAFTDISGTATIAQGGTNNGSLSVAAGSVYYGDGTKLIALAPGTDNQVLTMNGTTAIDWSTISTGGGFTISAKAGSYSATDGANYYYINSATGTITLPASPADGSVRKFVQTSGTGTFAFNGAETVRHANGTSDQSLTQSSTSGVIELIAVTGGWHET